MEGDVGFKSTLSSVQHWRLIGEEMALWLCDAIRCNPASCESPSVCLLVSFRFSFSLVELCDVVGDYRLQSLMVGSFHKDRMSNALLLLN